MYLSSSSSSRRSRWMVAASASVVFWWSLLLIVFLLAPQSAHAATPGGRGFTARLVVPTSFHKRASSSSSNSLPATSPTAAAKDQISNKLHAKMKRTQQEVDVPRGGQAAGVIDSSKKGEITLDQTVNAIIKIITTSLRLILPPTVLAVRSVVSFYSVLPLDAVLAQAGLVYCFAGGYFPTLFAAIQAAEHCGWEIAVSAIDDLADEAVTAIRACNFQTARSSSNWYETEPDQTPGQRARKLFTEKTLVIIKNIDPMKINQAVAALYTTWMGVSAVLERQFARTIALSATIGDYIRPFTNLVIGAPARRVVPADYHQWIPVGIGWACKATAMSIAWRIERVLTAYSSAIAGGLMCSRSIFRMIRKKLGFDVRKRGEPGFFDEILGYTLAGLGLYSQIGNGFSFKIPFPLSLVTWPFELLEKWIQWQITKM